MRKNLVVYALFDDRPNLERSIDLLRDDGFRNEDISVLFEDNEGTKDFAHEKGTKAPEGTSTGVVAGAAIGGGLGWLAGIGTLAIPGVGPFVAAGPIVATLAGIGAGGAAGGIAGALIGMGIPEYEAKRFEGEVKKGGILLSIHCDDSHWVDRAKRILEGQHARDISYTGEASSGVVEGTDTDKPRSRDYGQAGMSPSSDPTITDSRHKSGHVDGPPLV